MASKMSSIQPTHDDQVGVGDWLKSRSSSYLVQSFLGQGNFGSVAKCWRMSNLKTVAIKMMKSQGSLIMQAKEEVATLRKLKKLDSDKCNLVRWYQVFTCRGHICLEFEELDKSLRDFMNERYFRPLLLKEIRPIVQQLATALYHLKAVGLIHADLKLENVMLVNHARQPYRVKVIDFGLACDVSSLMLGSYIQTRQYRSPEIILGLPFTEAIDMWSLGCMVAIMYLGIFLYPGASEYDMMRYIVETQGQPPEHLLNLGQKTCWFFKKDCNSTSSLWKLKTPEEYQAETGIQPMETRRKKFSSLYDLLHVQAINPENSADKVAEMNDRLVFVDMLSAMLELDASKRITAHQVLEHQFTSMHHMLSMYPLSSHVRSCVEIMDMCQKKTLTSGSGKAASGSLQQPSSGTSHPVQPGLPPRSADRSDLSQPHCINPHPCARTQATGSNSSGMKRKVDDEDDTVSEMCHLFKRVKLGRQRRNCSRGSSNYIQANAAVRRPPAQPVHHHANSHPSKTSRTQSCIRPAMKRKADGEDVGHQQTDSDHYERYRKRFRESPANPRSTTSSSWTQSCVSQRPKRKMTHDEDDYEGSHCESKRVRRS